MIENTIGKIVDYLSEYECMTRVFEYIYDLSDNEVKIMVAVTALLILILVGRWFNLIVVLTLLFAYLFLYILYNYDFIDKYERHLEALDANEQILQEEMLKQ